MTGGGRLRDYRIFRVRDGNRTHLVVVAAALHDDLPDLGTTPVLDVVNQFPATPNGLAAAQAYIVETNQRTAALMREP